MSKIIKAVIQHYFTNGVRLALIGLVGYNVFITQDLHDDTEEQIAHSTLYEHFLDDQVDFELGNFSYYLDHIESFIHSNWCER